MGDAMLCLGNGITACETQRVVTSVDQCYTNGKIYVKTDNNQKLIKSEKITSENIDWVHHNNTCYIFPEKGKLTIQNTEQKGSWSLINGWGSSEEISAKIFSLWVDHGNEPQNDTYCYIVKPDTPLDKVDEIGTKHGFNIIENTDTIQAVENTKLKMFAVIFYNSGTIRLKEGLTVSSDKKALVLIDNSSVKTFKISVADPIYSQKSVNITLNTLVSGADVTMSEGKSIIAFNFPDGDYQGSAITRSYQINN
jgi:chondroitin AC lyase